MATDLQQAVQKEERRSEDEIRKFYKELLKEKAVEQRIVDEFRSEMQAAIGSGKWRIDIPRTPKPRKPHSDEEAVLAFGDSHIGKVVCPKHTLGFGHYNPWRYLEELTHMLETLEDLITNHTNPPPKRLHIAFLGDLIEGSLDHSAEIPQRGLLANQALLAVQSIYQFIARLSRVVPLSIRAVGGNHARWGNQRRVPTENRFSNWDYVIMGMCEAMAKAANLDRVEWRLGEGAFDVWDIFQWRFKIGHGEHLKGGDRALAIPAHAIGREINSTTQRYAARGERPPDYYIVGDKHRHLSVPTARGRFLINGAFFDGDELAMSANYSPNRPHQIFFGIHPKEGQTWTYHIWLDAAQKLNKLPFSLPARLAERVMEFAG